MFSIINEDEYVVTSKQKCLNKGMNPYLIPEPKVIYAGEELKQYQEKYKPLIDNATRYASEIIEEYKGKPILFCISDETGIIIKLIDDNIIFKSLLHQLGVKEGVLFSQEVNGTNVISLTLQEKRTIQLLGTNHYHVPLHGCACYGTAVKRKNGEVIGSISILTAIEMKDPHFFLWLDEIGKKLTDEIG